MFSRAVKRVRQKTAAIKTANLLTGPARLNLRSFSVNWLKDILRSPPECRRIVKRLIPIIEETYRKFLFREAKHTEVFRHLYNYFNKLTTNEMRLNAIESGSALIYLNIRPLKLEMDIVNQCNLRCIMCHFSGVPYSRLEKKEMSLADFEIVADQLFPICSQVSLSISAEPTMHGQLRGLLDIMGSYGIPFIFMSTNAILLTEPMIETLVGSGIHRLCISVDGARKTTYEKIRRGATLARLIKNIKTINRIKAQTGSAAPSLSFTMVLMRTNIEELPEVIRLAHGLGVGIVSTVHMVPLSIAPVNAKDESLNFHRDVFNRVRERALKAADNYGIKLIIPEAFETETLPEQGRNANVGHLDLSELPLHQKKQLTSHCYFPWHFVGLNTAGDILPCGWWYHQPAMGNIFKTPFETIWNNNEYQRLRSELTDGKLRSVCRTCPSAGCGKIDCLSAFEER